MKTQQLEIKLSNKTEEDIKKARRKSTQAGEWGRAHLSAPGQGGTAGGAGGGMPGRCTPQDGDRGAGVWEPARLPPGLAL